MIKILKIIQKITGIVMRFSIGLIVISIMLRLFTEIRFIWTSFAILFISFFIHLAIFIYAYYRNEYLFMNKKKLTKKKFQNEYKQRFKTKH